MPDAVSDKDVEQVRTRVDKLRERVEAEKAKATVIAADGANAVRLASLERQEEELKVELARLQEGNKPAVAREAVADATETAPEVAPASPADTKEQ